jgi:predicted porin
MKKSLIALAALSAFATAAQAQSTVSVYGIVDAGLSSLDATGATGQKVTTEGIKQGNASGSRLGFRGTEDLGGGVKANFVIEMTADVTGSTALTATRQAFVGLQSGAGELRIGTQNTVGFGFTNMFTPGGLNSVVGELGVNNGQQAAALDTFGIKAAAAPDFVNATTGAATEAELEAINFALAAAGLNNSTAIVTDAHTATTGTVVLQTAISANGGGVVLEKQVQDLINAANQAALNTKLAKLNAATYTSRLNNTVSYISPSFGGLQATVAYNYPTQTDNAATGVKSESSSMQLGAVYNKGPLSLGVALTQDETEGVTANRAAAAVGSTTATTLTTITGHASAASTSSATATTATTLRSAAVTATNTTSKVESDTLQLGAKYNFGPATLSLIHVQKDGKVDGAKLLDKKVSQLGVSAPIGKTTLFASYGDGEMKIDSTNKYDLSGYQVGAYYAMSKRTTAYALVGESKTEGKDGLPTLKENQYAVGLRHSF